MKNLEIEVKFYLTDLRSIRQRIIEMHARCHGRFFETNLRFEDPQNLLAKSNALLRLRKDKKTTLTYKYSPPKNNAEFKIFNSKISPLKILRPSIWMPQNFVIIWKRGHPAANQYNRRGSLLSEVWISVC
jgi:hypothetical protein